MWVSLNLPILLYKIDIPGNFSYISVNLVKELLNEYE